MRRAMFLAYHSGLFSQANFREVGDFSDMMDSMERREEIAQKTPEEIEAEFEKYPVLRR